MSRDNGMTKQDIKKDQNNKYRQNMVAFLDTHSHKSHGDYNIITSYNGEKMVVVITCKACSKTITFWFNL